MYDVLGVLGVFCGVPRVLAGEYTGIPMCWLCFRSSKFIDPIHRSAVSHGPPQVVVRGSCISYILTIYSRLFYVQCIDFTKKYDIIQFPL